MLWLETCETCFHEESRRESEMHPERREGKVRRRVFSHEDCGWILPHVDSGFERVICLSVAFKLQRGVRDG